MTALSKQELPPDTAVLPFLPFGSC